MVNAVIVRFILRKVAILNMPGNRKNGDKTMGIPELLKPCERCIGASMNDCKDCRILNSIPTKEEYKDGKMLLSDRQEDTAN